MEKDELLVNEEENKIPGEENVNVEAEKAEAGVEAETGTAEGGDEAATEDTPVEENVTNNEVVDSEVAESESVEETTEPESEPEPENVEQTEKMLTQSQVNELVGKARAEGRAAGKAEVMNELYGRYGVSDDNEMNDIFGKGQGYDLLSDEYNTLDGNYKSVAAENALLKSGVVADRWDDVKAILAHKGLDITVENIQSEMTTHPEWQNSAAMVSQEPEVKELSPQMAEAFAEKTKPGKAAPAQTSTIRKLGSNAPETKVDTEESDIMKMFGLK